jgi:hypothetical protein
MIVLAGPVFPEWYWGPLFFMVVFSPILVAAAVGTDIVVRRMRGRLPLWRRAQLWLAAAVVATLTILAVMSLRGHLRFEGESRAAAAAIHFTVHQPADPPAGMKETSVEARSSRLPHLIRQYQDRRGPGAYAYAFEQEPREVSLRAGACAVYDIEGTSSSFFEGPCDELRTASGRAVFTGPSEGTVDGRDAIALVDGTLVRLVSVGLPDPAVLAWFDSLRPVAVEDVDFKK